MIFRFFLYGLYLLLKVSSWISSSFKKRLREKDMSLVIRTVDGRYSRSYTFSRGVVTSRSGSLKDPDFSMIWRDAQTGSRIMFQAKNGPNPIMKAINNKDLLLEGDAAALTWFVLTLNQMAGIYLKKQSPGP